MQGCTHTTTMGGRLSILEFAGFNALFSPTKVHTMISAGLSNIVHALKKLLSTVVERNVHLFFQTFIAILF